MNLKGGLLVVFLLLSFSLVYAIPLLDFISPTPNNLNFTDNTSIIFNVSIVEQNLDQLIWNWNGTNYTLYDNSLVLMANFENRSDLGENSSYVVDISKKGNNFTCSTCPTSIDGKYGKAYNYSGSTSYYTSQNNLGISGNSPRTIAFWAKLESTANNQVLVSTGTAGNNQLFGAVIFADSWYFNAYAINDWDTNVAPDTNLNFHVLTYNGSTIKWYINGQELGSGADRAISTVDNKVRLGYRIDNWGDLNGWIDELIILNKSIDSSEVYQLYVSNLNKFNSSQWYLYVNQSKNTTAGLDQGSYTYQTIATNTTGSLNFSEIRTVILDSVAPNILIYSPLNGTYSTSSIDLNWSVNENISWCAYSLDNEENDTSITTGGSSTITYNATGSVQSFTVPAGVTSLNVKVWGAGGGGGWYSSDTYSWSGGAGGFSNGTISVTPGETLQIVVGVGGKNTSSYNGNGIGGYLGGGNGTRGDASGAGGGGLSGIFTGSVTQSNAIIIAAGGGGGTGWYPGGAGGGLVGGSCKTDTTRTISTCGAAGTQTAGGSSTASGADGAALRGGNGDINGALDSNTYDGGGGGGGYYGGEGGQSDATGGGGGSSYLNASRVSNGNTYIGMNGSNSNFSNPSGVNESGYVPGIGIGGWKNLGGNGSIIISYTSSGNVAINKTLTSLAEGTHSVIIHCNDSAGNYNNSGVINFLIDLVDLDYPSFSNYLSNNASLINSGRGLFNVTLLNTNGTVFLQINNTNITAKNLSANVYNASYVFTSNGTYSYRWISWGNGSLNNYNISMLNYYVVNYSCVTNLTNTSWTSWVNSTCSGNQKQQNRSLIQYDSNNCGYVNQTIFDYQFVGPTYVNTSWTNWLDLDCLFGDVRNQTRNLTQYDLFSCASNSTAYDYRSTEFCDYCTPSLVNTSLTSWVDQGSCKVDDLQVQNRSKIEYDQNTCGEVANATHWEYQNVSCNYCSYNVVNSSWSDWTNVSCLSDDTMNKSRYKTEYDSNYAECYLVTHLGTDLWSNRTYYEYDRTEYCDYPEPLVVTTSPISDVYGLGNVNVTFNCSTVTLNALANVSLYLSNNNSENFALNRTTNLSNWTLELVQGNYIWNCLARDIYGNSSFGSNRTLNVKFLDNDNDGVKDDLDKFYYNESYVNTTGVSDFNITIGGNSTSGSFDGVSEVAFYSSGSKLVNFSYNFTKNLFDLSKVSIIKGTNSIIINLSGQLQSDFNKTVYIEDNNFVSLCVKDSEITSISEVSSGCDGVNETDFTSCLGFSVVINGTSCVDEGSVISVSNLKYSAIKGVPAVVSTVASATGGGGGGGISSLVTPKECLCNESQYCLNNTCYDAECSKDSDCDGGESCWEKQCIKFFDMEILDFESPVNLGEFFKFSYFIKAVAEINGDVEIDFWIEKNGSKVTSGKDTIYMGSFEEKTKEKKLFLPSELESGVYEFMIKVTYGTYSASAHRTIEIKVKDGVATIEPVSEKNNFVMISLTVLVLSVVIVVVGLNWKRFKKIKN